jgi:hypothetical protein
MKLLIYLAPRAGFEPATNRLTAGCSTAELPGNTGAALQARAYNKRAGALQSAFSASVVSTRVVRFSVLRRRPIDEPDKDQKIGSFAMY